MAFVQDRKTCRHIWAPIAPKQTAPGLPPSDAEWDATFKARCEICGAPWATNQQQFAFSANCSVGSCQRHGRCMYHNHPRCPLAIVDRSASAPRRETGVARKGESGGADRQSPETSRPTPRTD